MAARIGFNSVNLISGYTYLYGRCFQTDTPIALDPASWRGALLFGSDNELHWSNGTRWLSSGDAVRSTGVGNITVEVLAGGTPNGTTTFGTLADALAYMARLRPAQQDVVGTVLIKTGHVVATPVLVNAASLGWVRIISEDAEVLVNEAAITSDFIRVQGGSVAPRILTMFKCQPDGLGRNTTGMRLLGSGYRDDSALAGYPDLHGFDGWRDNVVLQNGSTAFFIRKALRNARQDGVNVSRGSNLLMEGCQVRGAVRAVVCSRNASVHIQSMAGQTVLGYNLYRADPAGLADGANDLLVALNGVISIEGGISGGRSTTANQWTSAGYISLGTQPQVPTGIVRPTSYTVATVPSAATYAGHVIHVSNGDAGAPCLAVSDGSTWRRVPLGATVSAT